MLNIQLDRPQGYVCKVHCYKLQQQEPVINWAWAFQYCTKIYIEPEEEDHLEKLWFLHLNQKERSIKEIEYDPTWKIYREL